ncbi:hypothetical protein GYMLUDRAFT_947729 [Collybiopsis luxurians FD-317 M1]|uniref:C2H2-type domain-containing protein n=1 Tax=Collybiopsis luxurians FD-317 M1 TaxID=944289 RepID=A0A0D0C4X1_9AGAR|nr:hypothetical protein GYMLUDRAFT_947729 [Collybiopsis luxurians FD-317 M1]
MRQLEVGNGNLSTDNESSCKERVTLRREIGGETEIVEAVGQRHSLRKHRSSSASGNMTSEQEISEEGSRPAKRHRRRSKEIERKFFCTWPGCEKGYGARASLYVHIKLKH